MVEADNLGFRGFEINNGSGGPWAFAIGKFLINFGALEMMSYVWIACLGHNQILYELAIDMSFSYRVKVIHKLIDASSLSTDLKKRSKAVWKNISVLSAIRNSIAHNPLVFGWHNQTADGPPDYVGIPVMKKAEGECKKIIPIAENVSQMDTFIDEAVKLAQELEKLLNEVETANRETA